MNAPISVVSLDDRATFLGGSDVAGILGMSTWRGKTRKTPFTVWQEKVGQAEPDEPNEKRERRFKRGKRLEPVVLDMLRDEGIEVVAGSQRFVHPHYPFLQAEIDFQFRVTADLVEFTGGAVPAELIGTIQNGEVKSVDPRAAHKWGEILTDQVPDDYSPQSMHGLAVTGKDLCLYAVIVGMGDDELLYYAVRRDDDIIKLMIAREVEFWTEYVLTGIPPEPICIEDVQTMFRQTKGRRAEVGPEVVEYLREIKEKRDAARLLNEEIDELEFQVARAVWLAWTGPAGVVPETWRIPTDADLKALKEDAVLVCDGLEIATWKQQSRSSIDTKALQDAHPEICAQYQKQSKFRVLRTINKRK